MSDLLGVTLRCDNRCLFCAQAGRDEPDLEAADWRAALAERSPEERSGALVLGGGEPTRRPDLCQLVAGARSLGYSRIGLQTNGRRLSQGDLAVRLAAAGLDFVHLSLHGGRAEVHDYHTGVDGSFEALRAAAEASRAAGLTVVATTVVTRSNFRVVAEIAPLLGELGVAAWVLAMVRARGRAASGFDRLVPRLGLAVPFALHAIAAARSAGLPSWIRGAPLCTLGDYSRRALPARARAYSARCDGCAARAACPGVEASYLGRYGDGELGPLDVPVELADDQPELRDCFAGTGPLGPAVDPARLSPPPAERRRAIPTLGKPRSAPADRAEQQER